MANKKQIGCSQLNRGILSVVTCISPLKGTIVLCSHGAIKKDLKKATEEATN